MTRFFNGICSGNRSLYYRTINIHLPFSTQVVLKATFHWYHKLASWASVYTDAPFRQTRPPARFAKPACWGHPQSPYDCQLRCQAERRFTPLVTITYNKKAGQGRSGIHPFLPCPSHHYCYNSFRCCLAASRSFFRSSP